MKTVDVQINGKTASGVEVALPKAPLVLASGKNGFVMCGYLSVETADKLGVAAAVVRGVNNVDELLAGTVAAISKAASEMGVAVGMTGRDALSKFL